LAVRNFNPDIRNLEDKVVAPAVCARVEDRHFDVSLGISKRNSRVLGSVAVAA
jgi:hypothetical protein